MCCCGSGQVKLEIVYCESCGWARVAKKVVEAVRKQHPEAMIDCRPANGYTGMLQVSQLESSKKKLLFSGNKEEAMAKLQEIPRLVAEG